MNTNVNVNVGLVCHLERRKEYLSPTKEYSCASIFEVKLSPMNRLLVAMSGSPAEAFTEFFWRAHTNTHANTSRATKIWSNSGDYLRKIPKNWPCEIHYFEMYKKCTHIHYEYSSPHPTPLPSDRSLS